MANSAEVDEMLRKAIDKGALETAVIIGLNANGETEVYTHTADKQHLLAMLDDVCEGLGQ